MKNYGLFGLRGKAHQATKIQVCGTLSDNMKDEWFAGEEREGREREAAKHPTSTLDEAKQQRMKTIKWAST